MEPDHPPLAVVMDLLLDAVCVVDERGRYLFVSAGFERILGYRADEVIGRPMIELVHPDDYERTLQAAREIMAGEPKLHFQNRYVRKDGRVVDIQWSARWSESDRVRIAVGHDITELKRAEAMQVALLAISEAAHADGDLRALFPASTRSSASCYRPATASWRCTTRSTAWSSSLTSSTSTTLRRHRCRWRPRRYPTP